jgi:hypothetical protein
MNPAYPEALTERFGTVADMELELDPTLWSPLARRAAGLDPDAVVFRYTRVHRKRRGPRPPDLRKADRHTVAAMVMGHHMPGATIHDRLYTALLLIRAGRLPVIAVADRVGLDHRRMWRYLEGQLHYSRCPRPLKLTGSGFGPGRYRWAEGKFVPTTTMQ